MRYLGLLLTFALLAGATLTLLKFQRPDMFYSLMISFNLVDSQVDSGLEKERLSYIRLLPISDEKKQILIQHTVFMGATTHMVELALGKPKQSLPVKVADGTDGMQWVYQFDGDAKPTVLIFESDKLASAYRASAHGEIGSSPPAEPDAPTLTSSSPH